MGERRRIAEEPSWAELMEGCSFMFEKKKIIDARRKFMYKDFSEETEDKKAFASEREKVFSHMAA